MDTQYCRHVLRRREACTRLHVSVGNVAANLGGHVVMERHRVSSTSLDIFHGDMQSITIMLDQSTLTMERPAGPEQPQVVIREARRRQRRRWLLVAASALVAVAALGAIAWNAVSGPAKRPPPRALGNPVLPISQPPFSPGTRPLSTRPVGNWKLQIYASPSGLPIAKVNVGYELIDPHGTTNSSGSGSIGAALLAPPGIVNEGGGTTEGRDGWQRICYCQITLPAITLVRAVDGGRQLDSMKPVSYEGVRFVVLAMINVPTLQTIELQGLNLSGAVITSAQFDPPAEPLPGSRV